MIHSGRLLRHILGIVLLILSSCTDDRPNRLIEPSFCFRAETIDSVAQKLIQTGGALGFSIVVMHRKDVLYARGFGFRDLDSTQAFSSTTIFQIASISKLITSLAILKLVERGELSLDSKVIDILPSFPLEEDGMRIRVRHLLQHTSGLREYGFIADRLIEDQTADMESKTLLNLFHQLPVEFEPGSDFSYSNSGFLLLSLLIEEVSGKSYRDFVREEISIPLKLSTLDSWKENSTKKNISLEYVLADSQLTESRFNEMTWLLGDGGLSANSMELAQLPFLIFSSDFLPKSLLDEMWHGATLKNGARSDYGLGVRVGELFGEPVWGHTGGGATSTNVLTWFPQSEISMAIQVNTDNSPIKAIEIEAHILPVIFGDRIRGSHDFIQKREQLTAYEGDFADHPRYPHQTRIISTYQHEDGNLYRKIQHSASAGQKLLQVGVDIFSPENHPLDRVAFDRNEADDIVAMKDYYNGHFMTLRNKRIEH